MQLPKFRIDSMEFRRRDVQPALTPRSLPFSAAALLILATWFAVPAFAHDVAAEMADAADRFLRALSDQQRAEAQLPFDSDRRTLWHYVPDRNVQPDGRRAGLPIKEMNPQQRLLAHGLLATGLSHRGHLKAMTIMALETILRDLENNNPIRDPELYYTAIYGTPGDPKAWAWRFEGHHLSIHFTIVEGKLMSVTPSFFGSNPAEVRQGPFQGLRTLAAEEDLARQLVKSLSPEQRAQAILPIAAPSDIITGQQRRVDRGAFFPPQGIAFDQLTEPQQALLLKLVGEYASRYRREIVDEIDRRTPIADGKEMYFAWAGGLEPGEGHYYRIQTPRFLFEYDNTQGGANHVHAVWREFDGDFGEDLLRRHYETSPHHAPPR